MLRQKTIQQLPQLNQVHDAKHRTTGRCRNERIQRQHIGQVRRKRPLRTVVIKVKYPVRLPRCAALDEFVARPAERMERMGYGEPTTVILRMSCS